MKTALIIALICLIVGALIAGVGFVIAKKNPTKVVTESYSYSIDQLPEKINIDVISSHVEICVIEGNQWRVECKDTDKIVHTVELVDGILTIKQKDTRKWYERIFNFFPLKLGVTLYLPAQAYDSLDARFTSGGIHVAEGYTFSNVDLKGTSGTITMASQTTGSLSIKNTSGDISVSGSVGNDLKIVCTSGDIGVTGSVNGKLEISNTSGDIMLKNAAPTSVTIFNTSGDIGLQNVISRGKCEIDNTSGSITLERCDAALFDLKTTSGDIQATILSGKVFDCDTTSGSINVPANGEGGVFKADVTSGDINVTIAQ